MREMARSLMDRLEALERENAALRGRPNASQSLSTSMSTQGARRP
jgi:hypothetical protein